MMRTYRQAGKNLLSKTLGALMLLSLYSIPVHAQNEGRWYEVEVLVFKRQGAAALTSENWRSDIELAYPNRYRYLTSGEADSFSLKPQSSYQLNNYSQALEKKEDYKVLYHKAWTQQMQAAADSPAIIITGGDFRGDHKELEGYIKIHIARYLHLTTNLWLTTNNKLTSDGGLMKDSTQVGSTIATTTQWPKVPARPSEALTPASTPTDGQVKAIDTQAVPTLGYESIADTKAIVPVTPIAPIATLQQRRRMRSKELHYIDHPLMGLLILITPIDK